MIQSTAWRRFARNSSVLAAAVCVVMIGAEIGAGMSLRSFPDSNAFAASAGTAPNGSVVLSPASGALSGVLALSPDPAPAFCPGDSTAGYRWQTYISAAENDPATFVYDSNGPTVPGGGVAPSFPLVSSTGINQVNRNTAADTGDGGQITPIPGFDLSVYGALLPDGDYSIGFACSLDGQTVSFWTTQITIDAGSYSVATVPTTTSSSTSTTTSTTVAGGSTTTSTTVAGGTTSTTVSGGTTSTTVAGGTPTTVAGGSTSATVTPSTPTPGGSYQVRYPNCSVGETVTFTQPESTPKTVTDVCRSSTALESGSVAGIRRLDQTTTGTATGSFTSAPTAAGSYTITMTGTVSPQRTTTFVVVGASTPVTGGSSNANTGGSPTSNSAGTIPSTGSSTTSLIVWGVLLLVFGRMAILLGRKPKVLTGT